MKGKQNRIGFCGHRLGLAAKMPRRIEHEVPRHLHQQAISGTAYNAFFGEQIHSRLRWTKKHVT